MEKNTQKQLNTILKNALFFIGYVLAFVLGWLVVQSIVRNDYVFPSLQNVFEETGKLLAEEFFYRAFAETFFRVVKAFFYSFVCALVLAVCVKIFPWLEKLLVPVVAILRSLPTMAIILILLIWSTPDRAPVIIAFLALFPILYTGFSFAFSVAGQELEEMSKVFQVPLKKRVLKMYLPISLPYIVKESASGLSFGLKLVVSAEVLANTYFSVGGMLQLSKVYLETPRVFALTLLVVVLGLFVELVGMAIFRYVERGVK